MQKDPKNNNPSLEIEEAILGAILLSNRAIPAVNEIIKPDDFSIERNRVIFQRILQMWNDDKPVDSLTLQESLKASKELDRVGGVLYIDNLYDKARAVENVSHYARTLKKYSSARQFLHVLSSASKQIGTDATIPELIASTTARLNDLLGESVLSSEHGMEPALAIHEDKTRELFQKHLAGIPTFQGIQTGIPQLDSTLRGLVSGGLHIFAARTGVGKSILALNICANVALQNKGVVYFSPEMTIHSLNSRILARFSNIDSRDLNSGQLNKDEFDRYLRARERLSQLPVVWNDKSGITIDEIRQTVQKWDYRFSDIGGVALVIVDYLGLIDDPRVIDETPLLGRVSTSLKNLAKNYNCVVIGMHQLNREGETDNPRITHLRGADKIAYDADTVTFLYVKDADLQLNDDPFTDLMTLQIMKNREGIVGSFQTPFHKQISYVGEWDDRDREPYQKRQEPINVSDNLDDNFL